MSKKKKFKKFSKGMILSEIDKTSKTKPEKNIVENNKAVPVKSNISQYNKEELVFVRSDLMKVGIVFGSVIILLIIISVIQKQTPWLDSISDNLVVLFNLN